MFKKGVSFQSKLWLILVFQSVTVLFAFIIANLMYFQITYESLSEEIDNAFYFLASLTFGMMLLIGLSTYFFEKYLTAPIRLFMKSIESYKDTGQATEVDVKSNDEFEKLAFAYNNMISSSRLSLIDPMTNVFNRRYLDAELVKLNQKALEEKYTDLSLAIFDIDFFKRINDEHGHAIGDEAIHFLAECLKSQFRSTDVIARFGGEEFVVILKNSDLVAAIDICERVRNYIETQSFVSVVNQKIIKFTVSCGVANVTQSNYDADILFDLADQALLVSKQTGRNKVTKNTEERFRSTVTKAA